MWSDFDEVLAEMEGRNPATGRVEAVKPYVEPVKWKVATFDPAAYMRKRYAAFRARGLNSRGQPYRRPQRINRRYQRAAGLQRLGVTKSN